MFLISIITKILSVFKYNYNVGSGCFNSLHNPSKHPSLLHFLSPRCLMSPENSDPQFHLEHRGPVSMKGKKEPMQVWFLSRKNTGIEVWLIRALRLFLRKNRKWKIQADMPEMTLEWNEFLLIDRNTSVKFNFTVVLRNRLEPNLP